MAECCTTGRVDWSTDRGAWVVAVAGTVLAELADITAGCKKMAQMEAVNV